MGGKARAQALHGLGWLSPEGELPSAALALIETSLHASEDNELAAGLRAAAQAAVRASPPPHTAFEAVAASIAARAGPSTQRAFAQVICVHGALVTPAFLACALGVLGAVDLSDKAALDDVDVALGALVQHGHGEAAADFLTDRLSADDVEADLPAFDNFSHSLRSSSLFAPTMVRWLAAGTPHICKDLPTLLAGGTVEGDPLDVALAGLGFTADDLVFLSRKAVGFLFVQQVTAASILIAVLREREATSSAQAASLLFDPLLMSYPNSVRRYLEGVGPDDPAYAGVKAALDASQAYEDDLAAVGEIKAFVPSTREREIQHERHRQAMKEMHEAAHGQSIFRDIIPVSRILHGRAVRSVVSDRGGIARTFDTAMSGRAFSWEISRTEVADTVGLHHQILRFKIERRGS